MGSQLNTLPPHNDNYLSRMCGVVLDKYVWRSDLEKGKVVPPNTNTNTNTNMCEEVMWKKGRGAAKSRKGDDMRPPLRLHNLNDWETDRGLS